MCLVLTSANPSILRSRYARKAAAMEHSENATTEATRGVSRRDRPKSTTGEWSRGYITNETTRYAPLRLTPG